MVGLHSASIEDFAAAVAQRLFDGLDADDLDLIVEDDASTIAADEWSLRFESRPGELAWLAIDAEPDDPGQYVAVLHHLLPETVRRMFSEIDHESAGRLSALLKASGDPFSIALAGSIERT